MGCLAGDGGTIVKHGCVKHLSEVMSKEAIMRHGFDCSQSFESLSTFPKTHHDPLPAASSTTDAGVSLRELLPTAEFAGGSDILVGEIAGSAATAVAGELVIYRVSLGT